jgi:hypothetical protein
LSFGSPTAVLRKPLQFDDINPGSRDSYPSSFAAQRGP